MNPTKEIFGLNRITKKRIRELCKKDHLYQTPELNDVLYLHYQGFQAIECLEEYIALKCLWLESNAISEITGLEYQTKLKCLFLQNNLIKRIENLQHCRELDTLNLSSNHIRKIENCGEDVLPVLSSLNLSSNYLTGSDCLQGLMNCTNLTVLDLSNNRIQDIVVVKIFAKMPKLRVLVLQGNPVVSRLPQYRKTLILECKELTYLDSRPVFPRDRACAEAWKRGGYEEERRENERWNREERKKIRDSVNATLRLRNKRGGGDSQIELLRSSDDEEENNLRRESPVNAVDGAGDADGNKLIVKGGENEGPHNNDNLYSKIQAETSFGNDSLEIMDSLEKKLTTSFESPNVSGFGDSNKNQELPVQSDSWEISDFESNTCQMSSSRVADKIPATELSWEDVCFNASRKEISPTEVSKNDVCLTPEISLVEFPFYFTPSNLEASSTLNASTEEILPTKLSWDDVCSTKKMSSTELSWNDVCFTSSNKEILSAEVSKDDVYNSVSTKKILPSEVSQDDVCFTASNKEILSPELSKNDVCFTASTKEISATEVSEDNVCIYASNKEISLIEGSKDDVYLTASTKEISSTELSWNDVCFAVSTDNILLTEVSKDDICSTFPSIEIPLTEVSDDDVCYTAPTKGVSSSEVSDDDVCYTALGTCKKRSANDKQMTGLHAIKVAGSTQDSKTLNNDTTCELTTPFSLQARKDTDDNDNVDDIGKKPSKPLSKEGYTSLKPLGRVQKNRVRLVIEEVSDTEKFKECERKNELSVVAKEDLTEVEKIKEEHFERVDDVDVTFQNPFLEVNDLEPQIISQSKQKPEIVSKCEFETVFELTEKPTCSSLTEKSLMKILEVDASSGQDEISPKHNQFEISDTAKSSFLNDNDSKQEDLLAALHSLCSKQAEANFECGTATEEIFMAPNKIVLERDSKEPEERPEVSSVIASKYDEIEFEFKTKLTDVKKQTMSDEKTFDAMFQIDSEGEIDSQSGNSTQPQQSLSEVLTSFNRLLQEITEKNRESICNFEKPEKAVIPSPDEEKSASLKRLLKDPNTKEFFHDPVELDKELALFKEKNNQLIRNMVDRVYKQKDKYDDSLDVVDDRLVVVKKDTGAIEDLPDSQPFTISSYSVSEISDDYASALSEDDEIELHNSNTKLTSGICSMDMDDNPSELTGLAISSSSNENKGEKFVKNEIVEKNGGVDAVEEDLEGAMCGDEEEEDEKILENFKLLEKDIAQYYASHDGESSQFADLVSNCTLNDYKLEDYYDNEEKFHSNEEFDEYDDEEKEEDRQDMENFQSLEPEIAGFNASLDEGFLRELCHTFNELKIDDEERVELLQTHEQWKATGAQLVESNPHMKKLPELLEAKSSGTTIEKSEESTLMK